MPTEARPDFEIVGPSGDVKLVVEVKSLNYDTELARQHVSRWASVAKAPWAMVATPEKVELFRIAVDDHAEQVDSMPMSRLVAYYGRQNHQDRYFESYIRTMLELWLRDLTVRWKNAAESPPAFGPKEFEATVTTGTLLVEP